MVPGGPNFPKCAQDGTQMAQDCTLSEDLAPNLTHKPQTSNIKQQRQQQHQHQNQHQHQHQRQHHQQQKQ